MCATLPANFIAFEYPTASEPWWEDIVVGLPKQIVRNSMIELLPGPGLGLDIDPGRSAQVSLGRGRGIFRPRLGVASCARDNNKFTSCSTTYRRCFPLASENPGLKRTETHVRLQTFSMYPAGVLTDASTDLFPQPIAAEHKRQCQLVYGVSCFLTDKGTVPYGDLHFQQMAMPAFMAQRRRIAVAPPLGPGGRLG